MQYSRNDGTLGPVEEFNELKMQKHLQDPDIDHVDVFPGTADEILRRQNMEGKQYRINPRFRKTGSNKKRP